MSHKSWNHFSQVLLYILLINLALLVTSIGLHEAGHLVFGGMLGCTDGRIVLAEEGNGPYTELTCPADVHQASLGITGFPFLVLFAVGFLLLARPERHLGVVVIGLALMLAGVDVLLAVANPALTLLLTLAGAGVIIAGEVKFINRLLP